MSGALLYVYANGTTTKASIYSDEALTTPLANPVAANSSGQFPAIWASDAAPYTLSITGPDGESIGNPSVFDDYSVSTDADTASVALAEAAATAAEEALADALAIQAAGDDAAAIAARVAKNQNGADFADTDAVIGNLGAVRTQTGAVSRTVKAKLEDFINVADFGAVGDGVTDDTAAFLAAKAANPNRPLQLNGGTYLLGEVGMLGTAGTVLVGSRYGTVIKPLPSMTNGEAIFYNHTAGTSGSGAIRDIYFDLNGQDCVAIDLTNCNKYDIRRVRVKGGANKAAAAGIGVIMGSPILESGSYTNSIADCDFTYLAVGVKFDAGGNSNTIYGGECVGCLIGVDAAPGVSPGVDTPRIYGMRMEGCDIGLKEGAIYGSYFGIRLENNATADIEFQRTDATWGSDHPQFFGGYTAASSTVLKDLSNAVSPLIISSDLGHYEVEASASRTRRIGGRTAFFGAGVDYTATVPTGITFGAFFYSMVLLRNNVGVEGVNAAGTNSVIMMTLDSSNRTTIRSYNRATAADADVLIGGGSTVRAISGSAVDLGSSAAPWKNLYLSDHVHVDGVQVVSSRVTGFSAMTGTATKTAIATYEAGAAITAPTGGTTVDAESRTAIGALITRLATVEAALQALSRRVKADDDALIAHGLIGT